MVRAETDMLRAAGHCVAHYCRDNSEIADYSGLRKATLPLNTIWSPTAYTAIRALIRQHRPDIVHCHNLLPLVSPAAYDACRIEGVPVVQTLHNYRLFCPAGTFFFRGRRCEKCVRNLTHGIRQGCYRNSRMQTAAVSLMLDVHRLHGTWRDSVDAYLAPSQFCRDYFAKAGLPGDKVYLKPNFLAHDPGQRTGRGNYALFVGRLSEEKGVLEMIAAWATLREIPLLIAGDGPLYNEAQRMASSSPNITLLGHLDASRTLARIKAARFVIVPSRWYEPFGMVLLEAAACGVPAIASRIGAIPELVVDNHTGLLFDPDNFDQLADRTRWAWNHPAAMDNMGAAARQLYLQQFTAEQNCQVLTDIYRGLLGAGS